MKLEDYTFKNAGAILTPALAVYADKVDANIEAALRMMNGDANRWRPHIKTVKMQWVIERLLHYGVRQFKCATTRELAMACAAGAPDVLLAFPVTGPHARRVREIADEHNGTRVSVLVENAAQAALWRDSHIGIFVDVNPGMDRTGVRQNDADGILGTGSRRGAAVPGPSLLRRTHHHAGTRGKPAIGIHGLRAVNAISHARNKCRAARRRSDHSRDSGHALLAELQRPRVGRVHSSRVAGNDRVQRYEQLDADGWVRLSGSRAGARNGGEPSLC